MPFDIGIPELILIFVVVLVVFGPQKIPELARDLGKMVADLRRMGTELSREFMGEQQPKPFESGARRICPRCASPNPIANYYCYQCGLSLTEPSPPPGTQNPPAQPSP